MADPTTATFSKLRVALEDPAVPNTWVAPCGFNERSIRWIKNSNETTLVDCDNEDLPAAVLRDIVSLDWNIAGNGLLAAESWPMWEKFRDAGVPWRARVELELPAPAGLCTYIGSCIGSNIEITGSKGNRLTLSVQIDGANRLVKQ